MSLSPPRVTVLMPAYNAGKYIDIAVESILRQTFDDFELLVIEDGSTDDTRDVLSRVRDVRLRLECHSSNAGLVRRLNEGLRLARGTLVARLDADDVAHPRRLELQVAAFDADPMLVLVGSQSINIAADGAYNSTGHYPRTHVEAKWASCFDSPFNHSAVTFRRDVVLAAGGYDERFTYAEDYELWSRLLRQGCVCINLPLALAAYRHHGQQMTSARSEIKVSANVTIIASNLDTYFPGTPSDERLAMAQAIAETHFGVRPLSLEYLRHYRTFLSRFRKRYRSSVFALRRTLGVHLLGFASLAKRHAPLAAAALALAAFELSPEVLTGMLLPRLLRNKLAARTGRFWELEARDRSGTRHDA